MFHHLLESNAVRRPRVGGSLVSTVAHAALVAAAVTITTQQVEGPAEIPDPTARFIAVVPPPTPPDVLHRASSSAVDAPAVPPSLRAMALMPSLLDITVGIPSPDLTRSVIDATEFGPRSASADAIGDGKRTGAIVVDGSAWSEAQVDKPVVMLAGVVTPFYPAPLRSAGIAGSVLVEFVVDTLGRVEPGSLQVLQSSHELFSVSVRDVVPRWRFLPAEVGGRKVRQLVRQPFRFDLNPDSQPEIGASNTNVGLIRF